MKKILFTDFMGPKGHAVFNKIHIKAMQDAGATVDAVLGGQFKGLIEDTVCHSVSFVSSYDNNRSPGHLRFRRDTLKQWNEVKKIAKNTKYDIIVLSHFDTYLLPFLRFHKTPIYAIVHSPLAQINSLIKVACCRMSAVKKFVVFNTEMQESLNGIGIDNTCIIPHGFGNPFIADDSYLKLTDGKTSFIFCPSAWSTDSDKLKYMLDNPLVINFCNKNKVYFIIKNRIPIAYENKYVIGLSRYIPTNEYESLMKHSMAVLLVYGPDFKSKVSGVFFECMNNNIRCLFYSNTALNIYKNFLNYSANFNTVSEFITLLQESHKVNNSQAELFRNLDTLNPVHGWADAFRNK